MTTSSFDSKLTRTVVQWDRIRALLGDVLGPDTGPALTGVLRCDGDPVFTLTARRDGQTYTSALGLQVAATLSDKQLDAKVRWMVGHAIDELDGGNQGYGIRRSGTRTPATPGHTPTASGTAAGSRCPGTSPRGRVRIGPTREGPRSLLVTAAPKLGAGKDNVISGAHLHVGLADR